MNDRELWNELAKEYKYYIVTNYGKHISDKRFKQSGYDDYKKYILGDDTIAHKGMILEIGCGVGRLLEPMTDDYQFICGVDVSDEMINLAMIRLFDYKNIHLAVNDGRTIPWIDNTFDLVFSYAVFQHIKEYSIIEDYFREAYRVLKPKGIFKVLLGCTEYKNMNVWSNGICFTELMIQSIPSNFGYVMTKFELTQDGRAWLWLEKR